MILAARLLASGLRDVGRRRWLVGYVLFYLLLTDALLVPFFASQPHLHNTEP